MTIREVWRGVPVARIVTADSDYAVPERDWLLGVARTLASERAPYSAANDCDKFAMALKLKAQELHAKANPGIDGLVVGICFYKPDAMATGHAINWSITEGRALWFLEPQTGEELVLSSSERRSVSFVYC